MMTRVAFVQGSRAFVGGPFRRSAHGFSHHHAPPSAWPALRAGDPWGQPAGCLRVQLRYPAVALEDPAVASCLQPRPVHLLACSDDVVAAALAAGSMAGMLCHRLEAAEMAEEAAGSAGSSSGGCCAGSSSQAGSSRRSLASGASQGSSQSCLSGGSAGARQPGARGPRVVCLTVAADDSDAAQPAGASACSAAASTMLHVLRQRVPGLYARVVLSHAVLDDEWMQLSFADVLIVDWQPTATCSSGACEEAGAAACGDGAGRGSGGAVAAEERALQAAWRRLGEAGLLELLWQRFWAGCLVAGVGQGCALLGRGPRQPCLAPPVLPWYSVRAGGSASGWAALQGALQAQTRCSPGILGVGVLAGGCWIAHPVSGVAEMLAAPGREALVAAAAWAAQPANDPASAGLQEADDSDYGFFCELCSC